MINSPAKPQRMHPVPSPQQRHCCAHLLLRKQVLDRSLRAQVLESRYEDLTTAHEKIQGEIETVQKENAASTEVCALFACLRGLHTTCMAHGAMQIAGRLWFFYISIVCLACARCMSMSSKLSLTASASR